MIDRIFNAFAAGHSIVGLFLATVRTGKSTDLDFGRYLLQF